MRVAKHLVAVVERVNARARIWGSGYGPQARKWAQKGAEDGPQEKCDGMLFGRRL
jgi:hypothetical protein